MINRCDQKSAIVLPDSRVYLYVDISDTVIIGKVQIGHRTGHKVWFALYNGCLLNESFSMFA